MECHHRSPVPHDGARLRQRREAAGGGARILVACPLMHGTGMLTAMAGMAGGGCIVTQSMLKFDANELWTCVERDKVNETVGSWNSSYVLLIKGHGGRDIDNGKHACTRATVRAAGAGVTFTRDAVSAPRG